MPAARARLLRLGLRPYRQVWDLQKELHARAATGQEIDVWIMVEHPPIVTLGRNAATRHLLLSPEALAARGVDYAETERGGDVTYHGPGQLIVYPILKLPRFREIVPLVAALEDATIAMLQAFGIAARGRIEHRGVYVGDNAICAIGLSVRKMTSMHGIALNVCTNLDYDKLITPCGTPEFGITSISRELGKHVSVEEAQTPLLHALAERFNVRFEEDADFSLRGDYKAAS